MSVSMQILDDSASKSLDAIHRGLAPGRRKPFMTVLGKAAEVRYRDWFRQREATGANKKGWPRQHFWARIARATALDPSRTTDTTAAVAISHPAIAAKVHGATIRAKKPGGMIAIPVRAEAYGVYPRAKTIPGIFFVRSGGGKAYLARREGGALRVYWRLVHSVRVPKDPRALPPQADTSEAIAQAGAAFAEREARKGGAK